MEAHADISPQRFERQLRWLSRWDTEYAKFVDPKVQILTALEEHTSPRIREEVERFLEDVNEPARFHAVSALLAQDDAAVVPALFRLLTSEESVESEANAFAAGADDYILKPVEPRRLAARVKSLVARTSRGRQLAASP